MSDSSGALSIIGNGCWHAIGTWGDRSCARLQDVSICKSCPVYLEAGQNVLSRAVAAPTGVGSKEANSITEVIATDGKAVVLVEVGGNLLGIPSEYVLKVIRPTVIHRLPEARLECGLVSIDGEIHLWVSGGAFFELTGHDAAEGASAIMLLLEWQGEKTVIGVDKVMSVVKMSEKEHITTPFTLNSDNRRWVKHSSRIDDSIVAVVNIPLLLENIEGRI